MIVQPSIVKKKRLSFDHLKRKFQFYRQYGNYLRMLQKLLPKEANVRLNNLKPTGTSAFNSPGITDFVNNMVERLLDDKAEPAWNQYDQLELNAAIEKREYGTMGLNSATVSAIKYGDILYSLSATSVTPPVSYELSWVFSLKALVYLQNYTRYLSGYLEDMSPGDMLSSPNRVKTVWLATLIYAIVGNMGWMHRNDPYLGNMMAVENDEWLEYITTIHDASPAPRLTVYLPGSYKKPISAEDVFRIFLNLNLMMAWASPQWNQAMQKNWEYFNNRLVSAIEGDLKLIAKRFKPLVDSKEAAMIKLIVKTGGETLATYVNK